LGDIDEPAAVVSKEVVGERLVVGGATAAIGFSQLVIAGRRVFGVPLEVMADVEVEIAVAVAVSEGRRRWPVSIARKAPSCGDVLECPVATIVIQRVRPLTCDEQVRVSIIIDIPDGDAVAVATWQRCDSRSLAHVLERAVALVAEKAITRVRCVWAGGKRAPLDNVHVEPAVAVVIQQTNPAAHGLRKLMESLQSVLEREVKADRPGIIHEPGACSTG
jgi:hypothetical protein